MTTAEKNEQIGSLITELQKLRVEAAHVSQRRDTIRNAFREAFCESDVLELRDGRLFNHVAGEFVPPLEEYVTRLEERGGLAERILETERRLRDLGVDVNRLPGRTTT